MTVVPSSGVRAMAAVLSLAAAGHAPAADPQRGAALFATPPAAGLLACADCHGAEPQLNNFGNIWAGRNAVLLIRRAVASNTGGMGYFSGFYGSAELADIAAYLGNAPTALAFEPTAVGGDSTALSVTVATSTKIGVGALQLRTEGDFVVVGSNCGAEVPSFANCAVDLAFRPTAAGERGGALLIAHDGTPTPVRIALSGLATARPAAVARLQPARLDFARAGPPGVQSALVLNDSAERLTLAAITPASAAFRVVGGSCRPGAVLLPGRRCSIALRFDAAGAVAGREAAGDSVSTLTVRHDGVDGLSTLALAGRADATPPARMQADVPVVDFGPLAAGAGAAPQTVTWRNVGSAAWRWQATTVSAPGVRVLADGCGTGGRLAPGQACSVVLALVLALEPPQAGASSGRLVVRGSDGAPAAEVPVSGGVPAAGARAAPAAASPPARPLLKVDAATLDFGEQAVGGPAPVPQGVTLVNAGTAPWRPASITTTGADAAVFRLSGSCAAKNELEAGARCTVDVDFVPSAPGLHQASLLLQGADGDEPVLVSLSGRAVGVGVPRLEAHTAWLAFAPLRPGSSSALRLLVSNRGSAPADPPRWSIDGPFRLGRVDAACQARLAPGARCMLDVLFEPRSPGAARGRLRFGDAGNVALRGDAVDAPTPQLAWSAPPTLPSHGAAAVGGEPLAGAGWTLVNRGDAATAPLALSVSGAQAGDFSLPGAQAGDRGVEAEGTCRPGQVLAPRQACSVRVRFQPTGAGPRRAALRVHGAPAFADLPLEGRGLADARGLLQVQPRALWFDAPAAAGLPAGLFWLNDGPAALAVTELGLRGDGFSLRAGTCPAPPFLLQPGQQCSTEVAWNGGAEARFGADLVGRVDGGAGLAVPLAVVEDPTLRSNVGGSGGGAFGAAWVLALAVAASALRRPAGRCDAD